MQRFFKPALDLKNKITENIPTTLTQNLPNAIKGKPAKPLLNTNFNSIPELHKINKHMQTLKAKIEELKPQKELGDRIIENDSDYAKERITSSMRLKLTEEERQHALLSRDKYYALSNLYNDLKQHIALFNSLPEIDMRRDVLILIDALDECIIRTKEGDGKVLSQSRDQKRENADWYLKYAPKAAAAVVACVVPLTFPVGVAAMGAAHLGGEILRHKSGVSDTRTKSIEILDHFSSTLLDVRLAFNYKGTIDYNRSLPVSQRCRR